MGATTERGAVFRKILKEKYRMNVTMFAEEVGLRKSSIHHIVEGDTFPRIGTRQKLARVLDQADLKWLLFED